MKDRVDADALEKLQTSAVKEAFQVSDENPLVGAETRAALLVRLGTAMRANGQFFERDGVFRPGHILDYLRSVGQTTGSGRCQVSVEALWTVVIDGFEQVWPKARTSLHGYSLGDVWHHPALLKNAAEKKESEGIVPFHKLSQWLTYSLMEPLKDAGIDIEDLSLMTGVSYRTACSADREQLLGAVEYFKTGDFCLISIHSLFLSPFGLCVFSLVTFFGETYSSVSSLFLYNSFQSTETAVFSLTSGC